MTRALRSRPARPAVVVGTVELHPGQQRVRIDGTDQYLPTREFALLEVLMRHAGQVQHRADLLARLWDPAVDPRSLDVHVLRLRRRLEVDPHAPQRLVTVRGLGYVYVDTTD